MVTAAVRVSVFVIVLLSISSVAAKGQPQSADPCKGGEIQQLQGQNGTIRIPATGNIYENDLQCRWRITAPAGKVVKVTFTKFGVEQSENCDYDRLSIYDGSNNKSPLIGDYCGPLLPQELIQSSAADIFIYFFSDESDAGPGFSLNWKVVDKATPLPMNANCGNPAVRPSVSLDRIMGGEEAAKNSWPWMCSMRYKYTRGAAWGQWCGASILSSRYLITAAHCFFEENHQRIYEKDMKFICGQPDQKVEWEESMQLVFPQRIVIYDKYSVYSHNDDIALVQLSSQLVMNDKLQPVCLPTDNVAAGTKCVATGWGDTAGTGDQTVLRQVVLPVYSQTECSQRSVLGNSITNDMLCAGYKDRHKDACNGDSGGPLVCNINNRWYLEGVVSYGQPCAQGAKANPGVFARVTRFLDWIKNEMAVTS